MDDIAAPAEAKPLRLFAAVEIPQKAKAEIERTIEALRSRLPGGRWVKPENWHMTMKFMGRTSPEVLDSVRDSCRAAAARIRPFRVQLGALGVFPRPTSARVLWIGLDGDGGGLAALAAALDRELERDFPPEKRPFTAHLTVARFNPPARIDAASLDESQIDPWPFGVGELVLFRSHLSPKGARYEPLGRFGLRG